ncbi:chromatin remodeling complex subunit (Arp9) [Purpureocillium lavendulum]|uniref:Chromatin remodeling complex subunit (Arp9) n=1 Tax=Purpureocillium lavendulum TaxID=1247861 RepID=A0AB34G1C1_9HYPO|nr:chromatin remodeling complex subunit (Arp9) [Purpureocillium lavendulum]
MGTAATPTKSHRQLRDRRRDHVRDWQWTFPSTARAVQQAPATLAAPATSDTRATPQGHRHGLRSRKASRASSTAAPHQGPPPPTPLRRSANQYRGSATRNSPSLEPPRTPRAPLYTDAPSTNGVAPTLLLQRLLQLQGDVDYRRPRAADGEQARTQARTPAQATRSGNSLPGTTMATSAAKWREEQILVVCPGSRTTMAQLGCSELTPPTHRFPTRMFPDGDEWRPYHTYKRTRVVGGVESEDWVEDVDSDEGAVFPIEGGRIVNMDAFLAFLDHVHSMLTTTYHNTPIMLMASPQWTRPDCEAIAQYIFEKTRTPALCMIHSGLATQYGLKWPNMTVVDIGYEKVDVTAIHDGRVVNEMNLGSPNGDRLISGGEVFTQSLVKLLQGKGFGRDMAEQLKKSTICEVLPYAPTEKDLVELPVEATSGAPPSSAPTASAPVPNEAPKPAADYGGDEDESTDKNGDEDGVLDVAAIVTSGQTKEFLAKKEKEKGKPGRKPKGAEGDSGPVKPARLPNAKRTHNTFFYEEVVQEEIPKEQPKPPVPQETNGNGSGNGAAVAPATEAPVEGSTEKPAGEEQASAAVPAPAPANGTGSAAPQAEDTTMANGDAPVDLKPEGEDKPAESTSASTAAAATEQQPQEEPQQPKAEPTEPAPATAAAAAPVPDTSNDTPEFRPKRIRRDIEVGLERFTFAERAEIDRIVSTIYRTIQGIDDMYMRPACWDNLVFVGNGARLRGLRDNILQTLNARHLVSPSTATMFTSELPSNMATPTGTGSQTPTGSFTGVPHQLPSSGVNPLLQAATTASTLGAAAAANAVGGPNSAGGGAAAAAGTPAAGSDAAGPAAGTHYHFHSQTPTSIKTAALPTYLGEWTKNGFEEAMFLGAQVAARIAFCLHSNMDAQSIEAQRLMSLSRVDYNELGPKAIRTHSMLS